MSDYSEFQDGWSTVLLKDICDRITKGSTPTSYGYKYQDEGIRFIKAENIDIEGIASTTTSYINDETHEFLKRSILQNDDLLFSIAGTIGRVGRVREIDLPANTNQALAIIRLKPGVIYQKYLFYYLKSDAIQKESLQKIVGVGRANLSLTSIGEFEIPIAPLDQQKRIVAEIEKQFSRLDEAVANLKRVKANLKRYKAAVLKSAVEGKLTEEWRKQHPNVEPADKLLERILAERREKSQGRGKYKEPIAPDTTALPELPEGWVWTHIETVTDMMSGHAFKKAEYSNEGVRLFQIANVSFGHTKWEEIEHLPENYIKQWHHLLLKKGDVLMALNRPLLSRELKIARLESNDVPAILYQRVGKFLFYVEEIADYFLFFMQSPYYINRLEGQLQGVNIPFINKGKLLSTPISLPASLKEIKAVVDVVTSKVSVLNTLDNEIDKSLKRADRLRQSILKKAFSGKLVTNQ